MALYRVLRFSSVRDFSYASPLNSCTQQAGERFVVHAVCYCPFFLKLTDKAVAQACLVALLEASRLDRDQGLDIELGFD